LFSECVPLRVQWRFALGCWWLPDKDSIYDTRLAESHSLHSPGVDTSHPVGRDFLDGNDESFRETIIANF
jgi:hypothetical protein